MLIIYTPESVNSNVFQFFTITNSEEQDGRKLTIVDTSFQENLLRIKERMGSELVCAVAN